MEQQKLLGGISGVFAKLFGIKRHLFLGRKAMTNLDSILKRRNITLPTKVCLFKAIQ